MTETAMTGTDWSSYEYNEAEQDQNPYPGYDAMLAAGPVWSDRLGGYWSLSRYEHVLYAYQHPEIFSSYPNYIPAPEGSEGGTGAIGKLIPVEIDPPDHAVYRQLMAPPFSPREVAKYEPWLRARCDELLDPIIERGTCEFMSEFATPLPAQLWCRMMEVPISDATDALHWAAQVNHGDPSAPDGGLSVRMEGAQSAYGYLAALLAKRRAEPGDDLISLLARAQFPHDAGEGDTDRPLSDMEILNASFFVLLAGLDTTRGVLGEMMWQLARSPDLRHRLADEPEISTNAIEELTRLASPIAPGRTLTRDIELSGVTMRKGDRVLLITGAAARDPRRYDDPHQVDFDRTAIRHLAFGAGPHRCTGAHVARLELRIALEQIHRRMPDYTLAGGQSVRWMPKPIRGIEYLHLQIGSR